MIVGLTTSGKTTCFQTLATAMTELRKSHSDNTAYQIVKTHILNPKSISMGELYGEINELTQ
jgi:dynein heavy chain